MRIDAPHHEWLDTDAGPVVRPYAMTGGRGAAGSERFDLVAFVVAGPPMDSVRAGRPEPNQRFRWR